MPTQPHGGGHPRRLALIAAAVAVALAAAVTIVVAGRGGDNETSGSSQSPSTALTTTTAASTTASTEPGAAANPPPATATTAPAPSGMPAGPNDYAVAAFTAWQQGNLAALAELAEPEVVGFLAAADPGDGNWGAPRFEGAAGSTYATWTRPEIEFVVRVGNEMASTGQPHAVSQVFFWSAPGRVAIWPFTTQDEANATQEQVDQGHQPWLLELTTVVSSYAEAELGWANAAVATVGPTSYEVTDPDSGAQANLVVSQPARTGEGGIWAVTRAGDV
jgi:hypothetical protein